MKLIIYTDGGSRSNSATEPGPASCAFVAFDEQHKYVACLNETLIGSNNIAEYRGLLLAVNSLDPLLNFTSDVDRIEFRADSQLLVNQMTREWRCKDENLIALQHYLPTLSSTTATSSAVSPYSSYTSASIRTSVASISCWTSRFS